MRNVKFLIGLGFSLLILLFIGGLWVKANNGEKIRYNAIEQMSENRENLFDSMWKQINQTSQIAEKEKEGFRELVNDYMNSRGTIDGSDSFFSMLKEAYPTMPQLSYNKIISVVTGKRDEFQRYQTELKDRCRDYKNFTQTFPNSLFVIGRNIDDMCKIISSSTAKEVMQTKEENNIEVF